MKFGIRIPSLKRRIAARTSWKRVVRHNMGFKAPKGMGFLTNPKKAIYNRIYNKTSISVDRIFASTKVKPSSLWISAIIFFVLTIIFFPLGIVFLLYKFYSNKKRNEDSPALTSEKSIASSQDQSILQNYQPKDRRKAECPNCHRSLSKVPGAKTKCPHCGKFMFVRTQPDGSRVVVSELQAKGIEKQWSLIKGI